MDEQIWFYIIAALIYFFTRKKKKPKKQANRPSSNSEPQPQQKPVSFEELLREITEGRQGEEPAKRIEVEEEPIITEREEFSKEGETRSFSDEESRRIYEESIQRAKEIDHGFEPDKRYSSGKLVRKIQEQKEERTLADEIREDLQSTDMARKAIIYGEILNRRY